MVAGLLPSFVHLRTGMDLWTEIAEERLKIFVVGADETRVYFAVSRLTSHGETVLMIDGAWVPVTGKGWRIRSWYRFLLMLAEAWGCCRVETGVRDTRLLEFITKLPRVKIDYVAVRLEVDHG